MNRYAAYPVANEKRLYGIFLLEDMRALPRESWRQSRIGDAMRPVTSEMFVEVGTSLSEAREMMAENGTGALGVVDSQGKLVGFISGGRARRRP